MIAEIVDTVEAVTVATTTDDTPPAPQSGRAFPRVPQHVEFSLATSTSTTTTDFAFDCSSGVAKSCDLVLVHPHPHPPLCAGAYYPIRIADVSSIPLDDGVSPTVYNPLRIQPRAQRRTTRKLIHCLNLMNTAVAPAGAHAYLLGQLEEPAIHLHRLHRECYPLCTLFFFF
jgi:hypothetical protein